MEKFNNEQYNVSSLAVEKKRHKFMYMFEIETKARGIKDAEAKTTNVVAHDFDDATKIIKGFINVEKFEVTSMRRVCEVLIR